jgi:hypothetical protein
MIHRRFVVFLIEEFLIEVHQFAVPQKPVVLFRFQLVFLLGEFAALVAECLPHLVAPLVVELRNGLSYSNMSSTR